MSLQSPETSPAKAEQNKKNTFFLSQLNETHEKTLEDVEAAQQRIRESEQMIAETESQTNEKNGELELNQSKLTETINQITEIDKKTDNNKLEIGKNTENIKSIDAKIAELKKITESPETFEAVSSTNNTATGGSKIPENIQKQISGLEAEKTLLANKNTELQQKNEELLQKRIPLVTQRDELQKTIIPALQNEIRQLTELKKSQVEKKETQIEKKNMAESESMTIATQIESQEKEIAVVQASIARYQEMYAINAEMEARERPKDNFFENMATGIFA